MFGNSGSGKSTYARAIARQQGAFHLDLDTVAWDPRFDAPTRLPLEASEQKIQALIADQANWVIEGCYADLLARLTAHADEMVFLNPGIETCIANARQRPWEPHKYASAEAQDANLPMLIDWISQYEQRSDDCSLLAHRRLYESFSGLKREYSSNAQARLNKL